MKTKPGIQFLLLLAVSGAADPAHARRRLTDLGVPANGEVSGIDFLRGLAGQYRMTD